MAPPLKNHEISRGNIPIREDVYSFFKIRLLMAFEPVHFKKSISKNSKRQKIDRTGSKWILGARRCKKRAKNG